MKYTEVDRGLRELRLQCLFSYTAPRCFFKRIFMIRGENYFVIDTCFDCLIFL